MDYQAYIEKAPALAIEYGTQLLIAIAIFVIGKWLATMIANASNKAMQKKNIDPTIGGFAKNIIYAVLLTFVAIAALGQLGIQTASFVAIVGAAGLAVGFALQGSLSNFAAGVLMILFRPFKAGDFIEAGGVSGSVDEISVFSTKLRTGDNKVIIVPNSAIMGGAITNFSTMPERRVDLMVGVSYEADLALVKEEITQIISQDTRILTDKDATIAVSELADSSVNIVIRTWVKSADYWPVYFGTLEAIKNRFDQVGIQIPYPQLDLHVVGQPVKALTQSA